MKYFYNVFFTFLISVLLFSLQAQTTLDEGSIKYEITEVSSEDAQMQSRLSMMKGSTMDLYFNDGTQRTDMSMMGGMMNMTMIADTESEEFTNYMQMGGKKIMIPMSKEDLEEKRMDSENPEISYDKSDTKTIAGYDTYKATWTVNAAGQTMTYDFYITDNITIPGSALSNLNTSKLKGVPLTMTISMDAPSMEFTYEAQEVNEELPDGIFEFDSSGYEEMSSEEMENKFKGAGMPGM